MRHTMKVVATGIFVATILVLGVSLGITKVSAKSNNSADGKTRELSWNFDKVPVGKIPPGWRVEATNLRGGPMETWKVIKDTTAPSGDHVLAMTSPNHTYPGTFNLCWTDKVAFLDGDIRLRFKANKGKIDQGGGVIWRVQDKDNYYIARFNPLEDNFCLYYVRHGRRRLLTSTRVKLPAKKWHTMKIIQRGNHFEAFLNGKKYLEGKNNLFKKAGGVGLWTKSDAVTSFDDFSVKILKP